MARRLSIGQQIAADIRAAILSGKLAPDMTLESERKLVERYGTSKATVRKALDTLKAEGLLVGEAGSGTRVRRFKRYDRNGSKRHLRSQRPAGTSPTQAETQAQDIEREIHLLDVEEVPAPAGVAALLDVPEGAGLVCRRHLITLDGDPAQTADSYFVAAMVEGSRIARAEPIPGGVHAELAAVLDEAPTRAEEVLIARMPTPAEVAMLALLPGTPVIELTRTIYAADQPVEVTQFLFDAGWHRLVYDVPVD